MSPINRQVAVSLVEESLQNYRKISPDLPEEAIIDVKEIPYGWYLTIGLKNPSCSNVYYGAYTDYIVDRDYRFLHIANRLEVEAEIAYYEKKRMQWHYRIWWRIGSFTKMIFIKGQLYTLSLSKAFS